MIGGCSGGGCGGGGGGGGDGRGEKKEKSIYKNCEKKLSHK